MEYPNDGILRSIKKAWTIEPYKNMNEHEKHALIKKPHMKEHMLYYSLYMKYIEKAKTMEAEQKAEKVDKK